MTKEVDKLLERLAEEPGAPWTNKEHWQFLIKYNGRTYILPRLLSLYGPGQALLFQPCDCGSVWAAVGVCMDPHCEQNHHEEAHCLTPWCEKTYELGHVSGVGLPQLTDEELELLKAVITRNNTALLKGGKPWKWW